MHFARLRAIARSVARAPGPRHLRSLAFDRRFEKNVYENLFRGVLPSFEAALAACPTHRPVGYDNPESSALYDGMLDVQDYDYPAMFWLQRCVADGLRTIFDLGGHVGIKYYAFSKAMNLPSDVRWTVGDLPTIVARGRTLAAARGAHALAFADDPLGFDGQEVLLASGSLQYLPNTLAETLSRKSEKPRRIVVNITPIHESRSYFTVNSIGSAYCAYRVQERSAFVASIVAEGYELVRSWFNPGKRLDLPLEPGYGLEAYSGFYFHRG